MYSINVIDDITTEILDEGDGGQWGNRGVTREEHDIQGFRVERGYSDVVVPFEPEFDKDYYLLAVFYDTGDTFGHDENKVEFLELYEDQEVAVENESRLNKVAGGTNYATLISPNGTEYQQSTGTWTGYFESFNGAQVFTVRRERDE